MGVSGLKGLIEEIRTEEVEIKSLGEVVDRFVAGTGQINKNRKNDGNYPAIVCRDIFDNNFCINKCKYFVDETVLKKLPIIETWDILMVINGYTNKNKKGFCLYTGSSRPLAGNNIYILKHSQNPKYLSLALDTRKTEKQIENYLKISLSSVLSFHLTDIKKIKIPLPLLKFQQKIADFLFPFIKCDELLKREINHRKKQFEYFKELIFEKGINELGWEMRSVGEIATDMYGGIGISKEQLGTGNYPAIKCGDITSGLPLYFTKCISFVDPILVKKKKYFEYGDVLVGKIGNEETFGKMVVYLGHEKCLLGDAVYVLKHNQNPKYLAFVLSTEIVRKQIRSFKKSSTVVNFFLRDLKKLQIPLPPLEVQERIVQILDKFYDLSENPDTGLQYLIKQNQKQYEYYRELIFGLLIG